MTKEQARIKARAVAYEVAAALGINEAARIMREAASAVENEQSWGGHNDRR